MPPEQGACLSVCIVPRVHAGSCTWVHLLSTGHPHDLHMLFFSTDLELEVSVTSVCGERLLLPQRKYSTHTIVSPITSACPNSSTFRRKEMTFYDLSLLQSGINYKE